MEDMKRLATRMRGLDFRLEQVQDFTPTPMTLSSTIFYTGIDPYTDKPVFTEHDPERKKQQKSLFFGSPGADRRGAGNDNRKKDYGRRQWKKR